MSDPTRAQLEQEWCDLRSLQAQYKTSSVFVNDARLMDHFAGCALQGLLACPVQPQSGPDMYARDAYRLAAAMMAERRLLAAGHTP